MGIRLQMVSCYIYCFATIWSAIVMVGHVAVVSEELKSINCVQFITSNGLNLVPENIATQAEVKL